MKAFIQALLEESDLSDARASKMDIDTFLKLLAAFNSHHIHFTSTAASRFNSPLDLARADDDDDNDNDNDEHTHDSCDSE